MVNHVSKIRLEIWTNCFWISHYNGSVSIALPFRGCVGIRRLAIYSRDFLSQLLKFAFVLLIRGFSLHVFFKCIATRFHTFLSLNSHYCVIILHLQVSQYTFAMCSYRERKADPTEILQLDGFTVDFCEPIEGRVEFCAFT